MENHPPIHPLRLSRRDLMRAAGAWAMAMHAPLLAAIPEDVRPSLEGPPRARLRKLGLRCANFDATRSFYQQVFGWPVRTAGSDRFELLAGKTVMEFQRAAESEAPFYHFAFNISRNKYELARSWLAERTPIVRAPDGRDRFHFRSRDADAVYFLDPAGNLGELIAHSRLENERGGPFGVDDIHETCEIGLVTPSVSSAVTWLGDQLGARPYKTPTDDFSAVGDERGFFIVVRADRLWFPRGVRPAVDCPADVWIQGEGKARALDVPETSCRIHVEGSV